MEKIIEYQKVIKTILEEYIASMRSNLEEEVYLVEDTLKMNYLIYHNAWKESSRS
jgi:hypothetical protein